MKSDEKCITFVDSSLFTQGKDEDDNFMILVLCLYITLLVPMLYKAGNTSFFIKH